MPAGCTRIHYPAAREEEDMKRLWGCLGWFTGETFILFRLKIGEGPADFFTILGIQLGYFVVEFGVKHG